MGVSSVKGNNIYNEYSDFKVLNLKTENETIYPYVKGEYNVDTENRAIHEQMKITDLSRSSFMVSGLIKRGEFDERK